MKRRDKIILALLFCGLFVGLSLPHVDAANDFVSQWLQDNARNSSDGYELVVEFDPGGTIAGDFATTDSVEQVLDLQRTTTGTPANGIGGSLDFTVETSAGNNEIGARIGAVTTDVTGTSEDFDIVFYVMDAGAAAAEVARWTSDGILTLEGSATLDNSTSATELNITETTVQLTGAVNADGGITTINQDSGDFDFVVESDDTADALKVDAGIDTVQFGSWSAYNIVTAAAQSYSISSASKAGIIEIDYTTTGAATVHLMTDLLTEPGDGGHFWIVDKDGNANTNKIVIDTEGSETINGAATYTMDADGEAIHLYTDGTNFNIMGGFGE
jgi:hypothetical protein